MLAGSKHNGVSYTVVFPKSVQKQIDRLPGKEAERVLDRIAALETDPRPHDCKKLKGREAWRVRVGDYRIIYEIHDRALQIVLIVVGHRRDVYS